MKNLLKRPFLFAFMASSLIFTSCSDEENDFTPIDPVDPTVEVNQITVNPTNAGSDERTVDVTAEAGSTVDVVVSYTGDKAMRRIYMTKNVFSSNEGPQPFEYPEAGDKKNDGSIDLGSEDKTTFDFQFTFDAPDNANDVVQYVIWTTNNVGDFRDISNSNSIADDAYGVVTITAGSGATSTSIISEFSGVIELDAPVAAGYSETFLSVFNGETYKIVQQADADVVSGTFTEDQKAENAELSALWDFGYFYTNSLGASFASSSSYMSAFTNGGSAVVDITAFTGLTSSELNNFYFATTTLTSNDFDAATYETLDAIITPTSEIVNNMQTGDVIEFVDTYGNKGLIYITFIEAGFDEDDYIAFDVKVQINAIPVAL